MKKIALTYGKYALVDDEDALRVFQYNWGYSSKGYARGKINGKNIYMHRFILGVSEDVVIDHINHNKIDNRKRNLYTGTQSDNMLNKNLNSKNTTGFMGVWFNKSNNKYAAEIKRHGIKYFLGYYNNPKDAHIAYLNKKDEFRVGLRGKGWEKVRQKQLKFF